MTNKVKSTPEAWKSGELGESEEYAKVANVNESDLDEALELQMISIRMQKPLLDQLKAFAKIHGLGYQPLMKIILQRWVDGEIKTMGQQMMAAELRKLEEREEQKIEEDEQQRMVG